jgi:hypothetical protein
MGRSHSGQAIGIGGSSVEHGRSKRIPFFLAAFRAEARAFV